MQEKACPLYLSPKVPQSVSKSTAEGREEEADMVVNGSGKPKMVIREHCIVHRSADCQKQMTVRQPRILGSRCSATNADASSYTVCNNKIHRLTKYIPATGTGNMRFHLILFTLYHSQLYSMLSLARVLEDWWMRGTSLTPPSHPTHPSLSA